MAIVKGLAMANHAHTWWYTRGLSIVLTVIMVRRASIMPSITYRLLVRPPAHNGPSMVARPPTDRRTPWLKPGGRVDGGPGGWGGHVS